FDGLTALKISRQKRPEVPFIFVSGIMGEDPAIETLKGGATDYVLKQKLSRLVPALHRAMIEAETRKDLAAKEQALHDVLHRLQLQVRFMPLACIVWDPEYRIIEWNPAAETIFGWSEAEARGKDIRKLIVPPERYESRTLLMERILAESAGQYTVSVNMTKSGKRISCDWYRTHLKDEAGNLVGILSMANDITDRIRLEKQLQTAQRMEAVGTLAGGIAHDFNNALTVVIGFGEMLKLRIANDPKAISDLDEILRAADRAAVLTRQLLTFARRQIVEFGNLDMNRVIGDLEKLLRKVIREDIEIKTSLTGGVPTIRADQGQVEQVLMNLCLNARDAMPGGGQIEVETEEEWVDEEYVKQYPYMKAGRYAVLSVSDTGIGMDEETTGRIFEPFFTTKGPDKGTGLGLAVVYGIVKQHNGFIHVYSEPEKGTRFRIYFPAVDVPADTKVVAAPGIIRGGSETILLAEDNESVRHLAEQTLITYGYRVLVACDGEEAVDIFLRHQKEIAIVVLDMVMPKKGGKQAYGEMIATIPGLKAIFMSGYSANAIHDSFVLHPGIPFLQKPFGPGALTRMVQEVLDKA
ncbi:MAG: ATP-binding protein, partial [Candidatus Deferrimicrobium sp.]